MNIPDDAPKPRLCHIRKLPNFDGYGFNLHAEKGKAGQFIGKVDENSPAALAGLREGDRIVEVNGTNIGNENHQQVVQRIKAVAEETKFLVVDPETDDYYRDRKIVIRGDMDNVVTLATPTSQSRENGLGGFCLVFHITCFTAVRVFNWNCNSISSSAWVLFSVVRFLSFLHSSHSNYPQKIYQIVFTSEICPSEILRWPQTSFFTWSKQNLVKTAAY